MGLLQLYRGTGADLPFQDPVRAHPGVAFEGYFWRVTTPERTLIALLGVNQGPDGPWATVGLADSRGFLRTEALDGAYADPRVLAASSGSAFVGDARELRVDLGPDARLELTIEEPVRYPRSRPFGGSSVFQTVPALNQYWHPWLLGGRASGRATLGTETFEFHDAEVYGEKNWGREGFPDAWWWGQAQGFADDACVAFAGGQVHAGPLSTEVTGLVLRLPQGQVFRLGDPLVSPVHARVADGRWLLDGRSREWRVRLEGRGDPGAAHVLPVPLPSERRNTPGALEHLAAEISVDVRHRGRPVWRGTSALAGLEIGGLALAEAELDRRQGRPEPV